MAKKVTIITIPCSCGATPIAKWSKVLSLAVCCPSLLSKDLVSYLASKKVASDLGFNHYMLLLANMANTKLCKKSEKLTLHVGTQLKVLIEGFLMNTNMTGFRWFSIIFASLCFG